MLECTAFLHEAKDFAVSCLIYMKYKVYATVTGKIYIGEYGANNRIEAAKIAIEDRAEVIKVNLSAEGLVDVSIVPYDSVEVQDLKEWKITYPQTKESERHFP